MAEEVAEFKVAAAAAAFFLKKASSSSSFSRADSSTWKASMLVTSLEESAQVLSDSAPHLSHPVICSSNPLVGRPSPGGPSQPRRGIFLQILKICYVTLQADE